MIDKLAIILPCYNEEEVLPLTLQRLQVLIEELHAIEVQTQLVFVDDGSKDTTWKIIEEYAGQYPYVSGVKMAHNQGHQRCLWAGMSETVDKFDAIVTIDADLQDDLNCIEQMVDDYAKGYDIVYGVKVSRKADPVLKRLTAVAFYKLQSSMGVESVFNHADFRFLSRRVLEALSQYGERNLYLRGLIPLIGFDSTTVDDTISERMAGKSKYTVSKMFGLALNGITSFSVKPIYYVMYIGICFIFVSLLIGIYVLYSLITGSAEHGWSSLMLSIWLVGGITIVSIGGIGIYIGKIYTEIKQRPLYNIKEFLD